MYLTRTKLLIAGLLVAGALTTGIGSRLVSTAEAQSRSSEPTADDIKKALDYLRTRQARDRWEYKFVPVEKALVAADLQKLLSASDREGWEYCGTQDLVASGKAKGGAATPHMVFKRPRTGTAAADETQSATVASYLAALAAQVDAADKDAKAKQYKDAIRLYYESLSESQRKSQVEADRARLALEQEKSAMQQAEKLKMQAAQERDRAEQLEQILRKLRKDQDHLNLKIRELERGQRPAEGKATDPEVRSNTLRILLRHVNADDAAKALEKVAPRGDYKATIDTRSNSLIIQGPPEMLDKLKAIIDKVVDVKPAESTPATDKLELAVIPLKHIDAKAAQDTLAKTLGPAKVSYRAIFDSSTNSLLIAGSADAVLAVRKVIDALDRPPGPAK